jgi:hypothetical protein
MDRLPRRIFFFAAVYGIIVMFPQYFLEAQIGRNDPPPITHPEHFYGFIGVVLLWQIVFLLIARDVKRYRPLMPLAMLEKLAFGLPAIVLYAMKRSSAPVAIFGAIDLVLCGLFIIAFLAKESQEGEQLVRQ